MDKENQIIRLLNEKRSNEGAFRENQLSFESKKDGKNFDLYL